MAARESSRIEPIEGYTQQTTVPLIESLTRKHTDTVTTIAPIPGTDNFFSSGKDGFVSYITSDGLQQIWQISEIPIKKLAVDSSGKRIAAYETDGFSIHRISVWDWEKRQRLYAKRFKDAVTSLSWSAKGSFLLVGNSSLEGITILEGNSGRYKSVFTQSPGMVTLALTGASENSIITFGPSGNIQYTDLNNGKERASYLAERDLSQPILLNNNLVIAGYYDGAIYTVDATSGKTIRTYEANDPILSAQSSDRQPNWFENTEDGIVLKVGENIPVPILAGSQKISAAASLDTRIVFGTETGELYSIPRNNEKSEIYNPQPLASNDIQHIDDITTDGTRLFILSSGSVFITSGYGAAPVFAFSGMNANKITLVEDGLLFWSSSKNSSLVYTTFDGENRREVYKPQEGIVSLSVYGNVVSCVVGTSSAVVLDIKEEKVPFVFNGAGLQDAVLINSERLAISKSSTRISPHALLVVNTRTGETVPVPVEGDLVYALSRAQGNRGVLHAYRIINEPSAATEVISIEIDPSSISTTKTTVLARYAEEDMKATLTSNSGTILITLGKTSLVELQIRNGRQDSLERDYTLPSKPFFMYQYLVSLNQDGSITWYNRNKKSLICTAFISNDGFWVEK